MNQQIWSRSMAAIIFAAAAASSTAVRAAESESGLLNDSFTVSLGAFLLDTKTTVKVNGALQSDDSEVDFGRDLGFRDSDRFRVDATWRFAERHKLRAMYFENSQSNTRVIDRDITIRDTVYPVDGEISAGSSTSIFELAYEYVFLKRENYEIAASAGIHALKFKFDISGEGSVAGEPGEFRTESATTTAPLPVFGIRGLWEMGPKWYLDGQAQYFALEIGDVDGEVTDVRLGITRMFGKHFGIGAGWNQFKTKVGLTKERFDGDIRWKYSGAQLYLTASF